MKARHSGLLVLLVSLVLMSSGPSALAERPKSGAIQTVASVQQQTRTSGNLAKLEAHSTLLCSTGTMLISRQGHACSLRTFETRSIQRSWGRRMYWPAA